jgi:hypothetical protein
MHAMTKRWRHAAATLATAAALLGCGGAGNPLDNPADVVNSGAVSGRKLSFAYFQKCINPILLAPLPIKVGGTTSINTCAGSGCHDNTTGTGGAFRVIASATPIDLANPASTPAAIQASDIYKNFYSAQGEVVFGSPAQSRLLAKPRLLNVLHGGGLVFEDAADPNVKLIEYWIGHPMPQGQDEFGTASNGLFTPADATTGSCNTQ